MRTAYTIFLLLLTTISFGQNLETASLWRTKGVYDSLGNFLERAKIQSFLYASESKQLHRLQMQDRLNMETGESKVFVRRDTVDLKPLSGTTYQIDEEEQLTLHTNDSLTILYNGYHISYVKLDLPGKKVKAPKLRKVLINTTMNETVAGETNYQLTYQDNSLVKVSPTDSESEWESDYQLIEFNGFYIIQGIVSASKLVWKVRKKEIEFLEIDYRFETKSGSLTTNR